MKGVATPVIIARTVLPPTPNTAPGFNRLPPTPSSLSAGSQSSPLISTMLLVAGVGGGVLFFPSSGIMITPRGARWPWMLGARQDMSSGAEPPTAATESGKLLSPRREGKVRATGLIQDVVQSRALWKEVSGTIVAHGEK